MTASAARGVIVHDANHVERALRAAGTTGTPVHLISAPGASRFLGPDVFMSMTHANVDRGDAVPTLDCGNDAGEVLRALRVGVRSIYFSGDPEVADKLGDIATQTNAELLLQLPPTMDLSEPAQTDEKLLDWLNPKREGDN